MVNISTEVFVCRTVFFFLVFLISDFALSRFLFRCRKIFSDEKGKLEEAELSNALTEITAEHNSVIQTNTTESKA